MATDVPSYCQVLRFKDANGQVKEMIFPKALDLDRPKRPRTTFSESQLSTLEAEFQKSQYLIGKDRTRLAERLGLSETQIKVWFQNRRTKCKREKPEASEPVKRPASDEALPSDPTQAKVAKQEETPSEEVSSPLSVITTGPSLAFPYHPALFGPPWFFK